MPSDGPTERRTRSRRATDDPARQSSAAARRARFADQVAADADQLAADSDQALSDADQALEKAAQEGSETDQRASDLDQASADRERADGHGLSPRAEQAYQTARASRAAATFERIQNRKIRADAATDRDLTSTQRDRIADERDERGRARDAVVPARLPDAVIVTDDGGRIVLADAGAHRWFGYSEATLIGQPIDVIIPTGLLDRQEADAQRAPVDAIAHSDMAFRGVAKRHDGSASPVDVAIRSIPSAAGLLTVVEIRTERRMAPR